MDPSSVFRFVLALVLLPAVLRIGRGIRMSFGRRAFVYGVVFIIAGFGLQAVGPLVPWSGLRVVRHLVFAAGGFSLAWAAWQARRQALDMAEASS
jgi:hypothetical protein